MICKFSLQKNSVFYSIILLKQTPQNVAFQGVSAPGQSRLAGVWKNPSPSFSLQTKPMTVIPAQSIGHAFWQISPMNQDEIIRDIYKFTDLHPIKNKWALGVQIPF